VTTACLSRVALFGAWGARTLAVTASYNLAVEMHKLIQNQELSSEIMMFSDSQWRLILLQAEISVF